MIFDTGGGEVDAAESLQLVSSLFGKQGAYNLPEAPVCVPQGKLVLEHQMPYVWIPGVKPSHSYNRLVETHDTLSREI